MLIGLTGRPGAGQAAAADYLTNHGFVSISAATLGACTWLPDHVDAVVPDVTTPEHAAHVHALGGQLLHLVNATAPDHGPDPGLPLSAADRELHVPSPIFDFFNALDAVLANAFDGAFEQ